VTTRRDEDPATGRPDHPRWSPDGEGDDAPQPLPPAPGATRAERRRAQEAAEAAARRPFADAFTESPSGTSWPRPSFDGPPPTAPGQDPDSARPGATRPDTDGPGPGGHGAARPGGEGPGPGGRGAARPGGDGLGAARPGASGPGASGPGAGPTGVAAPGSAGPGAGAPRARDRGGDSDGPRTDAYGIRIDAYGAGTGAGRPTVARAAGEPGPGPVPPPRDGRVPLPDRQPGEPVPGDARQTGAFDPGDTGTWRVRDVVPGADGGRRTTVILRYLLGLLAVDHVRSLSRWAFALPLVGLVLLVVRPRWIGLAVIVLGVLLIVGRIVAVRMISRRTLPRRYRPVEDELRAAVEAGKANLRGELRRVGMPTSALALTRSVVRLGSSDSRRTARSRLRDIEIDRVLPRAQLDRALRVLDEAPTPR
jgi:hypothetical protein